MRFGQASMEVLLITAGVLVGAVAAGYYAISATTSVYHELNSVAGGGTTLTGSSVDHPPQITALYASPSSVVQGSPTGVTIYVSATDDKGVSKIVISPPVGMGVLAKTCTGTTTCSLAIPGTVVQSLSPGTYSFSATVTDTNGQTATDSNLFHITSSTSNQPPVASFTYSVSGMTVNFDASASHDPDGTIVSYNWNFGDGKAGSGKIVLHTYASAGSYTVTLTVKDNNGATDSFSKTVSVSASCSDECSPAGSTQTRCSGTVFQKRTCGNYDSDPCLEWSAWTDVNNCDSYDGWYGHEYRDYTCNASSPTGCSYTVTKTCSDECSSDLNRCSGNVFQVNRCGNYDSDPCLELNGWQDANNCSSYDGWVYDSSAGKGRYYSYTCDPSSPTGCSGSVTKTCSNECTLGDTQIIWCPKWICVPYPNWPGCSWQINWVPCGYKYCKTTCDSDPCTEWC